MKHLKKIYWTSTILFSAMILMGVWQYFFNTATVREAFTALGYPTYIVLPLGVAKLLGVIVILWNKNAVLKELAYVGFFYLLVLAIVSHIVAAVPSALASSIVLVLLLISYFSDKKLAR